MKYDGFQLFHLISDKDKMYLLSTFCEVSYNTTNLKHQMKASVNGRRKCVRV